MRHGCVCGHGFMKHAVTDYGPVSDRTRIIVREKCTKCSCLKYKQSFSLFFKIKCRIKGLRMIPWWFLFIAFIAGFAAAVGLIWWALSDSSATIPRNWR